MKRFILSNKNFIICCLIMATVYLLDSFLFFSQLYLLYDFFSEATITALSTGWAYLAQGAGLGAFILLYRTKRRISAAWSFQIILFTAEVPLLLVSLFIHVLYWGAFDFVQVSKHTVFYWLISVNLPTMKILPIFSHIICRTLYIDKIRIL